MADRPAPLPQAVGELWQLVVAYFRQETTEPLKRLGRVVGFGIAGSLLLGIGVMFIAIGALRVLQDEAHDTFDGNWTFVPYVIVIAALFVTALLVFKIGTRPKKKTTESKAGTHPGDPTPERPTPGMPTPGIKDLRP